MGEIRFLDPKNVTRQLHTTLCMWSRKNNFTTNSYT